MATSGFALNLNTNNLIVLFLMAMRIGSLLLTTPIFGARTVPPMIKIGLSLVLAFVLLPTIASDAVIPQSLGQTVIAIGKELLVGLLAGFAVTLVFTSLQIGAGIAGVQIGFGFSSTVDTTFSGQSPVLDHLFTGVATLLFLVTNLHHPFLLGVRGLFDVIPVNSLAVTKLSAESLIGMSASMFVASVRIVFPLVGALLLTDIAMAVIARTAPQMNIFFVGMPIKVAIGFLALIVLLPFLATNIENLFNGLARDMILILRYR